MACIVIVDLDHKAFISVYIALIEDKDVCMSTHYEWPRSTEDKKSS